MSRKKNKARRTAQSSTRRPRISLSMIAKNEEDFIGGCLHSVRDVVDEMIVVDTGSSDDTVTIAKSKGARIVEHAWQHDFSAARNAGLKACNGEFVLSLDADEQLDPKTRHHVKAAPEIAEVDIWYLTLVNVGSAGPAGNEVRIIRLFRNPKGTRYFGRIHEQIRLNLASTRAGYCGGRILHYGYQPSVFAARQKRERNLRLLELGLRDTEDGSDPVLRSNYLHYWALSALTESERLHRLDLFAKFVLGNEGVRNHRAAWIPSGLVQYADALRSAGRHDQAAEIAGKVLEIAGEAPVIHGFLAAGHLYSGDLDAAEREVRRALDPEAPMAKRHEEYVLPKGAAARLAKLTLAEIQERRGLHAEAEQIFRELLGELEAVRPWLAYVQLAQGKHREALDTLEGSGAPLDQVAPHLACLGFMLSLMTQSSRGLLWWGEKVRKAAPEDFVSANLLRRIERWQVGKPFKEEDFPELPLLKQKLTVG